MEPVLIHEADDFLVINKPAGIAVHPARTTAVVQSGGRGASVKVPISSARKRNHDIEDPRFRSSGKAGDEIGRETLVDWLVKKYPEVKRVGDDPKERPGIVHRLDKDTSGVMVVARTQDAFENLKQIFKERRAEKSYLVLVAGTPKKKSGVIDAPIGRLRANPTKRGVGERTRGSRHAITEYRTLERLGAWTLLEAKPKTGRMHQIRVHLASLSHPVAGDGTYGGTRAALPGLARQFLHAWRLAFSYPTGRRWQFEAALPKDLDAVLRRLRAEKKRARKA